MTNFKGSHASVAKGAAFRAPLVFAFISTICGFGQAFAAPLNAVTDLGVAAPSDTIPFTIWLKGGGEASLDATVANLYDPGSASYHQWLSDAQIAAVSANAQDLASAKTSFSELGLKIISVSEDGGSLKVSGTAAAVQAAFGTTVHKLQVGTKTLFKATAKLSFKGSNAHLVGAVSGLSGSQVQPMFLRQMNFTSGTVIPAQVQAGTNPLAAFTTDCFKDSVEITPGTYHTGIGVIKGDYSGPGYLNVKTTDHPECGMTASQVVAHYGLDQAHALGWTGKGQTIVIVDAYGSPTISADANAFSQLMGLPTMDGNSLKVVYSDGQPSGGDTGWATETTLDVEWAHAIAPMRKSCSLSRPRPTTLSWLMQFSTQLPTIWATRSRTVGDFLKTPVRSMRHSCSMAS